MKMAIPDHQHKKNVRKVFNNWSKNGNVGSWIVATDELMSAHHIMFQACDRIRLWMNDATLGSQVMFGPREDGQSPNVVALKSAQDQLDRVITSLIRIRQNMGQHDGTKYVTPEELR
jgi:hypothetical protein